MKRNTILSLLFFVSCYIQAATQTNLNLVGGTNIFLTATQGVGVISIGINAVSVPGPPGAGIATVSSNGGTYVAATNINFVGSTLITNNSGDVSIDITPGAGTVTKADITNTVQSYVGNNATNVGAAASIFHTNWTDAVSNRLDTFSAALTNHGGEILQSATNYAAGTANNVSNWVNAVSNRLDTFSGALTNAANTAMETATNFTRGITNSAVTFASTITGNASGLTNQPAASMTGVVTNQVNTTGWISSHGSTNWGDAQHTNWTTASTATGNDWLATNTAGGSIRAVNGRLIITANGTTTGGASNLVGGLTLGHTNDQRAYLTIGLTNGSGITNQYAFWFGTNGVMRAAIETNGAWTLGSWIATSAGTLTAGNQLLMGANYITFGSSSALGSSAGIVRGASAGAGQAALRIVDGNGTGNASNSLFIAGQCIASNGMVAKIHSTYGPSTNIVPLTVIPNAGGATNILEVQGTNLVPCFVVDSNGMASVIGWIGMPTNAFQVVGTNGIGNGKDVVVDGQGFVGIGTNMPAAPLHIVSTNVSGKMLVVQSNTTGTATMIVTNGRVGVGRNNPGYSFDVNGDANISGGINSGSYVIIAQDSYFGYLTKSRLYSPSDSYVSIVNAARTDASGLIMGTNSIAAPASGPTNAAPMLKKARQFSAGAGHTPGFKLTDNADGTNGCFLEIKAMSQSKTNLTCDSDSIIIFAVTNASCVAVSWVQQEDGTQTQFSPHADDAPAAFYVVTNWLRGIRPTIRVSRNQYTGTIEWNNDSLRSLMFEWMMAGTNIANLKMQGAVHAVETFDEYNHRTGSKLTVISWTEAQKEKQAVYDAERAQQENAYLDALILSEADPSVHPEDIYVKPAIDLKKPQPVWMADALKPK
jgi:hypothetical protein